jgi:hypothetical protein
MGPGIGTTPVLMSIRRSPRPTHPAKQGQLARLWSLKKRRHTESHVNQKSCLHELVSAATGNERVTHEPRHHTHTRVDTVHTSFGRTISCQLLPPPQETANRGQESGKNSAQVMSTPQPHRMDRYKTNHGHQNRPERRSEWPQVAARGGPTARAPDPATHTTE